METTILCNECSNDKFNVEIETNFFCGRIFSIKCVSCGNIKQYDIE